jgi:hypothetical protein
MNRISTLARNFLPALAFLLSAAAFSGADAQTTLKQGQGAFVSFQNGTLTLTGKDGATLVWSGIDDSTKAFVAKGVDDGPDRGYRPAEAATTATLSGVEPGTKVFVGSWFGYDKRQGVFIGLNRGLTKGTFVSYKEGDLSLLGVGGPKGSFTQKYGNSLFLRDVPDQTPVEESIDGAPFAPAGTAKTALPKVGEGSLVTVEFFGEGKITAIRIGEPAP